MSERGETIFDALMESSRKIGIDGPRYLRGISEEILAGGTGNPGAVSMLIIAEDMEALTLQVEELRSRLRDSLRGSIVVQTDADHGNLETVRDSAIRHVLDLYKHTEDF